MFARYTLLLVSAVLLGSCGSPSSDVDTPLGKKAILDAVDRALTGQDCATAVEAIRPLYNSGNTDNEVRLKMASAYGCDAKIDFLTLTQNLINKGSAGLSGKFLWRVLSEYFPSTIGSDYVLEGALYGTEALQATLVPGAVILPANQVNSGTANVGSIFYTDRTSDANIYLSYMGMAGVGGVLNRYGSPVAYLKTVDLPWTTAIANTSTTDGCAIASSLLNMLDGMKATVVAAPGTLSNTYAPLVNLFETSLNLACDHGCKGTVPALSTDPYAAPPGTAPYNKGGWVASGCAIAAGCATCPSALRDRNKCAALTTDEASCAAAGLVNFVNKSYFGWN